MGSAASAPPSSTFSQEVVWGLELQCRVTSCPGCLGMRDLQCPHQVSLPLALPGAHPLPRRAPACVSVASSSVPASSCPCPRPSRAQAGMLLLEVSLPAMPAGRDSRPPHNILWGDPRPSEEQLAVGQRPRTKLGPHREPAQSWLFPHGPCWGFLIALAPERGLCPTRAWPCSLQAVHSCKHWVTCLGVCVP